MQCEKETREKKNEMKEYSLQPIVAYVAFILRHLESGIHSRICRETDKTEWFFSFLLSLYVADLCKREVAGQQGKIFPSFVNLKKKKH